MRVLVLSPHPDDEAIGCGGTLCRHADAGDRLRVLYLTSGEQGGHGRPEAEVLEQREREARAAGELLGVHEQEFWRERDGGLRSSAALVARLQRELRRWRPDRVYAPSLREGHDDHRSTARLAVRVLAGRRRPELLFFEVWTPLDRIDEIVDISAWMERKVAAVRAYRSQCRALRFDAACRGLARWRGEMFCWPKPTPQSGRYAEVFARVPR